ncbi:MAG: hypothetical protein KF797_11110 [Flavobacteriales bacterium]|nr:hypothetical protein [Flavobacteriales bacterium]
MAVRRTRIAVVDLSGHHKIFRCYIEMHALADAYAKAKAVSGRLFRTGSEASWIDFRNKMEQNLRSEYRKVYEREVRQELSAILTNLPNRGFGPYIKYLCDTNEATLKHRRDLDHMIHEEIEYARRNEGLFGFLGKAAVVVKFSADIGMAILGAVPGISAITSFLTGLGYSAAQDAIKTVEASKGADAWVIKDSSKTLVLAAGEQWLEKGLEIDKVGATKAVKGALALESIYSGLLAAADDWRRFQ